MFSASEFQRILISAARCRRILLATCILVMPVAPLAIADDGSRRSAADDVLEEIRARWKDRTARFDSVKFLWVETREYNPGSLISPQLAEAEAIEGVDRKKGWPEEKLTVKIPRRLILQAKLMKHVTRLIGPARNGDAFSLSEYSSGYDGDSSRILFTGKESVTGSIRNEQRNCDSAEDSLRPLMYFARPFDTSIGMVRPSSLKLVQEKMADGTLVVEASGRRRFVVDPHREFHILSWTQGNRRAGGNLKEGRIEYRLHDQLGWIPDKWELKCYSNVDPGRLMRRHLGVMRHVEAGVKYDQDVFRIEFPVGAQVFDHHTAKEYIVLKDGGKRDVSLFRRR